MSFDEYILLGDDPTTAYARAVVDNSLLHCRWVRLAAERHLHDLARDDVWFDADAAQQFFDFAATLEHYKGPHRGKPLLLEPFQQFALGSLYGWKRVVDGRRTDLVRFRWAYLEVPRKNGKTTTAAAVALYDLLAEPSGVEVYVAATKEAQSAILVNDCRAFVRNDPRFIVHNSRYAIYNAHAHKTSYIKPLGSNSDRLDGLNSSTVIADELHAWAGQAGTDLWSVLAESFGARENYRMLAITTAGSNRDGPCWAERENLIDILEGRVTRDDKFGVIWTADEDEQDDWTNEQVWAKANPGLGTVKSIDYMRSMALGAQQVPSRLNSFRSKQLNIWTNASSAWLKWDPWRACAGKFSWETLRGKRCTAAFDLSRSSDLSAVAYWFPIQPGLDMPHLLVDAFAPRDGAEARAHETKLPLLDWARDGWLTLTPGKVTDFEFIKSSILKRCSEFVAEKIGYDRYFAGELIGELLKEGLPLVPHGTGYRDMTNPAKELERLVIAGAFRHNANPVLDSAAAAVIVTRDASGNIKPDREASTKKIDAVVASIMALGVGMLPPAEKPKRSAADVYGKRGIRTLGTDDGEETNNGNG